MVKDFRILGLNANLPLVGPQELTFGIDTPATSKATILIGKNGSGKSTLLRDIVDIMRSNVPFERASKLKTISVSRIRVRADEKFTDLELIDDAKMRRAYMADKDVSALRPHRLIALSFTPFDKFPIGDRRVRLAEADDDENLKEPFYHYLGFKPELGNGSPRARLLQSLDELAFAGSSPSSDMRVTDTLGAIGFGATIRIEYRVSMSVRDALSGRSTRNLSSARIDKIKASGIEELLSSLGSRGNISYTLDFMNGRYDESAPVPYETLRDWVRNRFLQVHSVKLSKIESDDPIELLELSSGELNILSGFLGLAAYLDDGCLILVDEPENSLHPEWQLRYVEMLEAVLQRHQGCHYIIATHSPLIVSGVADENAVILRLDQSPVSMSGKEIADESPDATLINAFDVVTPGNSYLRQVVLEAMSLVQTGEVTSQRARDLASFLANVHKEIPIGDGIRALIPALVGSIVTANTAAQ